jgi:hypothetical protein
VDFLGVMDGSSTNCAVFPCNCENNFVVFLDRNNWEDFEFFCFGSSVNSTYSAFFFWKALPNS